jgi:hypothetical protein
MDFSLQSFDGTLVDHVFFALEQFLDSFLFVHVQIVEDGLLVSDDYVVVFGVDLVILAGFEHTWNERCFGKLSIWIYFCFI